MKLLSVSYDPDGVIKLCLAKNQERESERIVPELVRHVTINYDVGLIDNPHGIIKETLRIQKEGIEFNEDQLNLYFQLDGLIKPTECKLTLRSVIFYLKDQFKMMFRVNQTHSFLELISNNYIKEDKSLRLVRDNDQINETKGEMDPREDASHSPSPQKKATTTPLKKHASKSVGKKEVRDLFVDSYEKFKEKAKKSELLELMKTKMGSIEFSLKDFGISLLCKLLLLIKYLNELVDNDFQEDLKEFLKIHVMKESIAEAVG